MRSLYWVLWLNALFWLVDISGTLHCLRITRGRRRTGHCTLLSREKLFTSTPGTTGERQSRMEPGRWQDDICSIMEGIRVKQCAFWRKFLPQLGESWKQLFKLKFRQIIFLFSSLIFCCVFSSAITSSPWSDAWPVSPGLLLQQL